MPKIPFDLKKQNPPDKLFKKRKTIGFLINQLPDRYQSMIWPGIVDVAASRDVNLLVFVGKSPKSPYLFEDQHYILYKLVGEDNVDGLIILTGAIGNYLSNEELTDFCSQFNPLPIVNIALPVGDIPTVLVDNKSGMKELVNHMIERHGYKRIAFIRGLANNNEAEIRYDAYREALEEHHLPFDEELVFQGNFVWLSGIEAIKTFLDERKVKFDALVAANDDMLLGAYRELTVRGFKIPGDIAIGGFDNIEETRINNPPITTVSQPFYEQAKKATEMLLDLMDGKPVQKSVTLPAKITVRQSCGCQPNYTGIHDITPMMLAANQESHKHFKLKKDLILSQFQLELKDFSGQKDEIITKIEQFVNALVHDLQSDLKDSLYLQGITQLINEIGDNDNQIELWKKLLSKLDSTITPQLEDHPVFLIKSRRIFNTALIVLLEAIGRNNENMFIRSRDSNWALRGVTQAISTSFDLEYLKNELIKELPRLGIKYCYMALYQGIKTASEIPTPHSRLFLAYEENKPMEKSSQEPLFDSKKLLPESIIDQSQRYCMVIYPLVLKNEHYGFILFDFDARKDAAKYETLQEHISSSLKGSYLLEKVTEQTANLLIQKEELSQSLEKLRHIMGGFISAMTLLVENRDPYTAGHQKRVADLSRSIAVEMHLDLDQIEAIRIAGIMHDLGKIYVPTQILNKPGKLLDVEFNLIKIHPEVGYSILKPIDFPWPIADIVLQHHERLDGKGYPLGLKGNDILLEAKIIAVADTVEAMASHRPYRPSLGIEVALLEIEKGKGTSYEPYVVDTCIKLFREKGYQFKDDVQTFQYPKSK